MNSVNLSGRVDSEPRLMGMPGRDVCEFWLAVIDGRKEFTLHLKVLTFRVLAERVAARLSKGDWVAVGGYLRSEEWPGSRSGRRLYEHTLTARHVDFGSPRRGGESQ
ncbi:MAG TPA: single-stranded DNA-binding protein [Solirubrobacterales bacterium]|jgi:single-stranded DNA-binding protein|nr:single-stranded DNA-binding protein [Solirubrobacterales bacterium]